MKESLGQGQGLAWGSEIAPHIWGSPERLFFFLAQHTSSSILLVLRPKCGLRMGKCVLGWTYQSPREGGYPGVPPRIPVRAFVPPAGTWSLRVGMSLPSTIVLSGTKEMRSWAALVWHLGAQEQVGTAMVS